MAAFSSLNVGVMLVNWGCLFVSIFSEQSCVQSHRLAYFQTYTQTNKQPQLTNMTPTLSEEKAAILRNWREDCPLCLRQGRVR
jgi:hypothetical protein